MGAVPEEKKGDSSKVLAWKQRKDLEKGKKNHKLCDFVKAALPL